MVLQKGKRKSKNAEKGGTQARSSILVKRRGTKKGTKDAKISNEGGSSGGKFVGSIEKKNVVLVGGKRETNKLS